MMTYGERDAKRDWEEDTGIIISDEAWLAMSVVARKKAVAEAIRQMHRACESKIKREDEGVR